MRCARPRGLQEAACPQRERLLAALAAAQSVATDLIAERARMAGTTGPKVGEMIHKARIGAVARALGA
jgi:tRNA nucleotidyltransferase (CCA-adding enzyme)